MTKRLAVEEQARRQIYAVVVLLIAVHLEGFHRVGLLDGIIREETLGVFVPVGAHPKPATSPRSRKPTRPDVEAIRRAGAEMDAMIAAMRTSAEDLIADFEKARREKRASRARA